MKLLIPVGAIVFGAGVCCCGGGDFAEGLKQGAQEAIEEAEQNAAPSGDAPMAGAPVEAPVAAGSKLDGACGRFAAMGVPDPGAAKVTICTTDSNNDTLIMNTTTDTAAACKVMKGWVDAQGFSVQSEGTFAGTSSIVAQKGSDQLVVACMEVMGKNSVTMTLQTR